MNWLSCDRPKKSRMTAESALGLMVEQRHAFLDEAFGAGEADAALIGKQFTDGADAAAAEMVDVIEAAFALLEAEQIFRGGDQVILGQDARVFPVFEAEFLVDFVTADAAQVVALGIEEQPFEERARVGGGGRIARTQPPVNVFERFLLVLGRVLFQALDDDAIVRGRIHDFDFGDAQFGDLLNDGFGEGLECARHDQSFLLVHGVLDQDAI
jgi:hypothetical protein